MSIENEGQLQDLLSEPTEQVVAAMEALEGDILLLGAGGKMGPSLAAMALRASQACGKQRQVLAVSRFSSEPAREQLEASGIRTIRCDLLDESAVESLPDAENIIYMPGLKFGTSGAAATTWAINTYLPGIVCRRYSQSRMVAFSTGNVYPLVSVASGGCRESDKLLPVGEYAMSALGRERMLEYFSRKNGIPMAIIRLNYACDLQYGVLVDLATQVRDGEAIDLSMGYFNTLWQGDANAMTLRAFAHATSPPRAFNVTGLETLSVQEVARKLGNRLGREPQFVGTESGTALLSNAEYGQEVLGAQRVPAQQLIEWVADWVGGGGALLGKPTHFATRDGKF